MKTIRKKNGAFQVYKVLVTDRNGELRSATYPMSGYWGYWDDIGKRSIRMLRRRSLRYYEDWPVFAKYGKIFAFRTLKAAKEFAEMCRNQEYAEIWEAEALTAEFPRVKLLPDPYERLAEIKRFWEATDSVLLFYRIRRPGSCSTLIPSCTTEVPDDTLFCDGLRLVRKRNR
jgi:hypothetical protein